MSDICCERAGTDVWLNLHPLWDTYLHSLFGKKALFIFQRIVMVLRDSFDFLVVLTYWSLLPIFRWTGGVPSLQQMSIPIMTPLCDGNSLL